MSAVFDLGPLSWVKTEIDSSLDRAKAATKIRVARLLLHASAADIQEAAELGQMMEFAKRARVRADVAYAVRQCLEAIEIVYMATGGSGISETNPMQRAWRDVHAVNMHGLMNLHMNQEMYGRIVLGLEPNTPLI